MVASSCGSKYTLMGGMNRLRGYTLIDLKEPSLIIEKDRIIPKGYVFSPMCKPLESIEYCKTLGFRPAKTVNNKPNITTENADIRSLVTT
jgi:hypothetical protein